MQTPTEPSPTELKPFDFVNLPEKINNSVVLFDAFAKKNNVFDIDAKLPNQQEDDKGAYQAFDQFKERYTGLTAYLIQVLSANFTIIHDPQFKNLAAQLHNQAIELYELYKAKEKNPEAILKTHQAQKQILEYVKQINLLLQTLPPTQDTQIILKAIMIFSKISLITANRLFANSFKGKAMRAVFRQFGATELSANDFAEMKLLRQQCEEQLVQTGKLLERFKLQKANWQEMLNHQFHLQSTQSNVEAYTLCQKLTPLLKNLAIFRQFSTQLPDKNSLLAMAGINPADTVRQQNFNKIITACTEEEQQFWRKRLKAIDGTDQIAGAWERSAEWWNNWSFGKAFVTLDSQYGEQFKTFIHQQCYANIQQITELCETNDDNVDALAKSFMQASPQELEQYGIKANCLQQLRNIAIDTEWFAAKMGSTQAERGLIARFVDFICTCFGFNTDTETLTSALKTCQSYFQEIEQYFKQFYVEISSNNQHPADLLSLDAAMKDLQQKFTEIITLVFPNNMPFSTSTITKQQTLELKAKLQVIRETILLTPVADTADSNPLQQEIAGLKK